jgi:nitrogen fixation NifU-like protein
MHSARFLDHFQNPRNVGQLAPPAFEVEVSNPACGDVLVLYGLIERRIGEVRYQVRGCGLHRAGSALTELLLGRRPPKRCHQPRDIEAALGGLHRESNT